MSLIRILLICTQLIISSAQQSFLQAQSEASSKFFQGSWSRKPTPKTDYSREDTGEGEWGPWFSDEGNGSFRTENLITGAACDHGKCDS